MELCSYLKNAFFWSDLFKTFFKTILAMKGDIPLYFWIEIINRSEKCLLVCLPYTFTKVAKKVFAGKLKIIKKAALFGIMEKKRKFFLYLCVISIKNFASKNLYYAPFVCGICSVQSATFLLLIASPFINFCYLFHFLRSPFHDFNTKNFFLKFVLS